MANFARLRLMSGKDFFADRYEQLGWKLTEGTARQAIRLNLANTKKKNHFVERLQGLGLVLDKIPFLDSGYWVRKSKISAGATVEYLLGLYSIQEAAAQIPVTLFSSLKGRKVLDACAAPGGKTVQIADRMDNSGLVIALDINKKRLVALSNHLERCHVRCVAAYNMDAKKASTLNLHFERILLDVPCSGNFYSDSQWFRRRSLKDVEHNAEVQKKILKETVKCLSADGEIVYSTCSLEPEENELNMQWALDELGLQIEQIDSLGENGLTNVFGQKLDDSISLSRRIWPGDTQGFFVCKLRRKNKET
jgi:NOL1/NOP2/sun family putative RNA methylase